MTAPKERPASHSTIRHFTHRDRQLSLEFHHCSAIPSAFGSIESGILHPPRKKQTSNDVKTSSADSPLLAHQTFPHCFPGFFNGRIRSSLHPPQAPFVTLTPEFLWLRGGAFLPMRRTTSRNPRPKADERDNCWPLQPRYDYLKTKRTTSSPALAEGFFPLCLCRFFFPFPRPSEFWRHRATRLNRLTSQWADGRCRSSTGPSAYSAGTCNRRCPRQRKEAAA